MPLYIYLMTTKIDIKERRHVTDKSDIFRFLELKKIVKFLTVHTVQTLPELTIFIL